MQYRSNPQLIIRDLTSCLLALTAALLVTVGIPLDASGQAHEITKLFAADGAANDYFAANIAVDGNTAVFTAGSAQIGENAYQGAAYVYIRNGDVWTQQAKLVASDGAAFDQLGVSVAIDGDTILIGNTANSSQFSAVYVFVRSGTTWTQQAKITNPDFPLPRRFGERVALSGDTAIISGQQQGPGAAYIFTRTGSVWGLQATLIPSDGADNDQFGGAVDIDGNVAVVGSSLDDVDGMNNRGSAYVFTRNGPTWTEAAKLVAPDGQAGDNFGVRLAVEGGLVVVAAPNHSVTPATPNLRQGAIYTFTHNGSSWVGEPLLAAADGQTSAGFGGGLDLSGPTLVAAAAGQDIGTVENRGMVYVYSRVGSGWEEKSRLVASDGTANEYFGVPAVSGDHILVGHPNDRVGTNNNQGSAYYYRRPSTAPDLRASSDSGTSDSDNLTNARNPVFDLAGLTPGAEVRIYRSGDLIHTFAAEGTSAVFTDSDPPATGTYLYRVAQTFEGEESSGSTLSVTYDAIAPVISIGHSSQQDPTSSNLITFMLTIPEPLAAPLNTAPLGFGGSTADLTGATLTVSPSGTNYFIRVGNIQSDGMVKLHVNPEHLADPAGNLATVTVADNEVTRDSVGPTVTMNQLPDQPDPTPTLPIRYRVVFSEPVTGFDNQDILFNDSTATSIIRSQIVITGSSAEYLVTVNQATSDGGYLRLSVRMGAVNDAAFNPNSASTGTDDLVVLDNVQPRVTINKAPGQADPTNAQPVRYSVAFTEPVTGFGPEDISFAGSSFSTTGAAVEVTGSGANYTVTVSDLGAVQGNLVATIPANAAADPLGNLSRASTSTDTTVFIDTAPPTVTVNRTAAQPNPSVMQPLGFTVLFSEAVSGFTAEDVSLAGSTANVSAASVQVTGTGSVYHVLVRNVTSSGVVMVSVGGGAAQDPFGNLSLPSAGGDNTINAIVSPIRFDYDGDGRSDLSVRRPSDNTWYLQQSAGGFVGLQWGVAGDQLAPADYDGDGRTDIAVFRPNEGAWHIFMSGSQSFQTFSWGAEGDVPVPADHDGDGRADLVVYRGSSSTFYMSSIISGPFASVQFGTEGDRPQTGDFDADGRADVVVFRPSDSTWYQLRSGGTFTAQTWGEPGDVPVPADYDGDGATDLAVFRPSTGQWFRSRSSAGFDTLNWGANSDIPIPADFDADGKADPAVFRPSDGNWYMNRSSTGLLVLAFGQEGDVPTQSAFIR